LGSHLERYLVDAMRRLVSEGKWVPNAEKSRLWYGQDGMFLLWPQAAADVIELLRQDQLPGIPQAPATIAEILGAAGVIEPRAPGSLLWDVFVPNAAASFSALKVSSPLLLLAAMDDAGALLQRELLKPGVSDKTTHSTPAHAQLTLPIPQPAAVAPVAEPAPAQQRPTEADEASLAQAPLPLPVPVALIAPPRLNPAVRDALQQIIATLDSPALPLAAFVIELGVFVPLEEFERRSVDPALAVRALSDARMLAADPKHPQSKTLSRTFQDESILGLVLASCCITGLDQRVWSERAEQESHEP